MNTVRVGRPRPHHKGGVSLNIFLDRGILDDTELDSVLLATAYGKYEGEARTHANLIAHALGEHFSAKVRT